MARLRGTGLGAGMALGTAAVVQLRDGVPLMPQMPPRIAAMAAQRRLTETPEVVVVAEDYRTALAIAPSLSWATVVAIAAERDDPAVAVPSVPAVTGLAGLMRMAADDVLILVDATRGIALVDPDPIYLAQYTAEHDRIAPKNRLYLDDAHLPAYTLDGHAISVIAITQEGGVEGALASGPDALYHALPLTFDPADLRRNLADVSSVAAGKPLIVPYNPSLPLSPLIEAASYIDITLAVSPSDNAAFASPRAIKNLLEEIDLAQTECAERDILCATPRIAAEVSISLASGWTSNEAIGTILENLAEAGATRLISYSATVSPMQLEYLVQLAASSSENLMPLTFHISEYKRPISIADTDFNTRFAQDLCLLIGAGVTGFLVSPKLTQPTKEAIRAVGSSECCEQLSRWLSTHPPAAEHSESSEH